MMDTPSNNIINVISNDDSLSQEIRRILVQKLEKAGYFVPKKFEYDAMLIICIGGDGAFLNTLHTYNFPDIPFIGVNTGHLGFFQEILPYQLDELIFRLEKNEYKTQNLNAVSAVITYGDHQQHHITAMNEIIVRSSKTKTIHLNISLNDEFLEKFSGDGVLVSTSPGSTAYNYALGGSIVDPRLKLLQITPIAPINSTAYRSFTSSVIVPPTTSVNINPENAFENSISVAYDGIETTFNDLKKVSVEVSDINIRLLRLDSYNFWDKVKSKFL